MLALLHHGHLAAAVVRCVGQTVDGAALGTGGDGHTGDRLGALHAVDRSRPQQVLLHLLAHTHGITQAPIASLSKLLPVLTSSSSPPSDTGPFCCVSWKRIFFIFLYCRLSSSLTASFVRAIKSMITVSGRSRHKNRCCGREEEVTFVSSNVGESKGRWSHIEQHIRGRPVLGNLL